MLSLLLVLGWLDANQSVAPPVTCVAARADGALIVAGAQTRLIVLSRAEKGQTVPFLATGFPLVASPKRITALAFSPDGSRFAIAAGIPGVEGEWGWAESKNPSQVRWSPTGKHKDLILGLAWSQDGKQIATTGHDRLVQIHDAVGSKPSIVIKDHSDAVTAAIFVNPTTLASCGYDRVVKLFNAQTGQRLQSFAEGTDWLMTLAADPAGMQIVSGGKDRLLRFYRAKMGSFELAGSAFAHAGGIVRIASTPDGKRFFSLGEDQKIQAWDPGTWKQAGGTWTVEPGTHAFAPIGSTGALISVTQSGKVLYHGPEPAAAALTLWPAPPKIVSWSPGHLSAGKPTTLVVEGSDLRELSLHADAAGLVFEPRSTGMDRWHWSITWKPGAVPPEKVGFSLHFEGKPLAQHSIEIDRFFRLDATSAMPTGQTPKLSPEQILQGVSLVGALPRPGADWTVGLALVAGQPVGLELLPRPGVSWAPEIECVRPDGTVAQRGKTVIGWVADQSGDWKVRVRDEQWRGSPNQTFRLELGPIPTFTGVIPRSISAGSDGVGQKLRWLGVHLPQTETTVATAGQPGQMVSAPATPGAVRPAGKVQASFVSTRETTDPNKVLDPSSGGQFLLGPAQPTVEWRFQAKKGEPLVLSGEAQRHGGSWDPYLEILDEKGQPVPRAKLRAIAKTNVTFRDHNAAGPGIRIDTWGDLRTNDFLLAGNDLMRIRQLPRNPDDDCQFYSRKGKRLGYLGTTPTHHPNGQEMFRVDILPPAAMPVPNGMPVVDLHWFNDDGDPEFAKDARLLFDPPTTGTFRARIGDAQGVPPPQSFGRFGVRAARPDFTLRAQPVGTWHAGGTALVQVAIDRLDGFDAPVEFSWVNDPKWRLSPGRLGPTDEETILPLAPTSSMTAEPFKGTLIAAAKMGDQRVQKEIRVELPQPAKGYGLKVTGPTEPLRLVRGSRVKCALEVTRPADFQGRVPIDFKGLPFGCQVLDIGLNGILLLPGEKRRVVEIACEEWVPPGTVHFAITARQEGKDEVVSLPIQLDLIDRSAP